MTKQMRVFWGEKAIRYVMVLNWRFTRSMRIMFCDFGVELTIKYHQAFCVLSRKCRRTVGGRYTYLQGGAVDKATI